MVSLLNSKRLLLKGADEEDSIGKFGEMIV